MRCCNGFFMGNSLSDSKDLLIPFVGTNPTDEDNIWLASHPGTIPDDVWAGRHQPFSRKLSYRMLSVSARLVRRGPLSRSTI
jgi:hypothetical protein